MDFVTVESLGELHENQQEDESVRWESVCVSVE